MYGAEVMLLNLIIEQQKMGNHACIASVGTKGDIEKDIEIESRKRGITVKIFRMLPGPNLFGALDILRFANKNQFNIIHTHGYKGNILFGALPKYVRRMPIISTIHGYTSLSHGLSKIRLYEWLDTRVLNRLDKVVLVNQGMVGNPKLRSLNQNKYQVIDNGISETAPLNECSIDETIKRFCDHPFVVGAIGRLSEEKGFHILIRAFHLIIKDGLAAKLVIIGEVSAEMNLKV